jgi:DNA-binding winged helix-turn-helix (wHTH) protein
MARSDQPVGYRFGSLMLDLEWGGLLAADGTEIPLRPKSLALLRLLAENAGRIVSQEAIMAALWPNLFVTENNVTQCVHEVRRALGPEASCLLQTVPQRGYRFASDTVPLPAGNLPPWKSETDASESPSTPLEAAGHAAAGTKADGPAPRRVTQAPVGSGESWSGRTGVMQGVQ